MCDMTHSLVNHLWVRQRPWNCRMGDMTHSFVACDITHSLVNRHMCDMTHSRVMRDITHSFMNHLFIRQRIWNRHMCDTTHSFVVCDMTRDSFMSQLIVSSPTTFK